VSALLLPNAPSKSGWKAVGAATGWEATRRPGEVEPGEPTLASYIESEAKGAAAESINVDNYAVPEGETMVSATLHVYGVATTGFSAFLFGASKTLATVKIAAGAAAWHTALYLGTLTAAQINELLIEAQQVEGAGNRIYDWYIDLKTTRPAPPAPSFPPSTGGGGSGGIRRRASSTRDIASRTGSFFKIALVALVFLALANWLAGKAGDWLAEEVSRRVRRALKS